MKLLLEQWKKYLTEEAGEIRLYHRTSPENVKLIKARGFDSKIKTNRGTEVYFSNREDGQNSGYGEAIVAVDIPKQYTNLDDEFPDGEEHYWVSANNLKKYGKIIK